MRRRSDFGMPCRKFVMRACPEPGRPHPRRGAYWWSRDIADLWSACVRARRRYTRYRRKKRGNPAMEKLLYETYREAKKSLQQTIIRAKTQAWEELLGTLARPLGASV